MTPQDEPTSVAAAAEAVLSVENAGLPLFVMHPDGRVAMANRAMRALLGYGLTDIVNRRVWDLHAEPEQGKRYFAEVLEAGQASENYLMLCRRDGKAVATYSSAVVVRDDRGAVSLVIAQSLPI